MKNFDVAVIGGGIAGSGFEHVYNIKLYLYKMVTNRCIDYLQSSSKQREVYVGTWLPEPLVTEAGGDTDPFQAYMLKESISTAYLLLLQQLSYVERAVFLLREALQYDYDEIADIIGKSSTNCRQIFHRAKRSLGMHPISNDEGHPARDQTNLASSQERTSQLVDQFMRALATGDIDKLMNVLSRDAILFMDSGGKVTAPPRSIQGSERISRFLASLPTKIPLVYRTNYPSSTANWESSCMRTDKRYPSFRFLLRTAALPGYTPLLIRKS